MSSMITKGTKIKLISMYNEPQMPSDLIGTVEFIDDVQQIHINWENGSSLALISKIDKFEIL